MFRHKCEKYAGPTAIRDENGRGYRTCMKCFREIPDSICEETLTPEQLAERAKRAAEAVRDFEPGVPKNMRHVMNPIEEVKPRKVVKIRG